MDIIYTIAILVFAFIGFLSSRAIYNIRKGKVDAIHCTHSCEKVITSRFSHFLGIPTEVMGMYYYAFIFLFFFATLFFPFSKDILFIGLIITLLAFIYSLHLIFVQLAVLKRWCTVCLWSSAASFMIVVLAFLGYHYSFGYELFELKDIFIWIYFSSIISGAILSLFYMKDFILFIRDFKITRREEKRLSMFSHGAWVAITLAILSGTALVLTDEYGDITGGSRFWILSVVLVMLGIYEMFLNHFHLPKLLDLHFGDIPKLDDHEHSMLRKKSFVYAFSGLVSWYFLLLLSVFPFYSYSSLSLFIAYFVLILIASAFALYLEYLYYRVSKFSADEGKSE